MLSKNNCTTSKPFTVSWGTAIKHSDTWLVKEMNQQDSMSCDVWHQEMTVYYCSTEFLTRFFQQARVLKKKKNTARYFHCKKMLSAFKWSSPYGKTDLGKTFLNYVMDKKNELSGKDVFLDYILPYCDSGRSFSWQCCLEHRWDTVIFAESF